MINKQFKFEGKIVNGKIKNSLQVKILMVKLKNKQKFSIFQEYFDA